MALSLAVAGPVAATNIGEEGCTPGYWKNHTDNWEEYSPGQTLDELFDFPASLSGLADDTLLEALNYGGGPGLTGGAEILMRAAVAAYLNAAHEGLGYPYRRFTDPGNLEAWINSALASEHRGTMISLAATLDAANNLGCPLN
jgi:hypothetical protein